MIEGGAWQNQMFRETVLLVFGFLIIAGLTFFVLKRRSQHFTAAWASVTSWFLAAPIILVLFGLKWPWPLVFIGWVAIISAKTFYQMVGMYHRSWFIWNTYAFIAWLGYMIYSGETSLYNVTPMIFLFVSCLIPILRNSASQMIQYLALAQMAFAFWGWSFMHVGRLMVLENGILIVLYLYILTEFSEASLMVANRFIGKIKPFSRISAKITLEGLILSTVLTLLLAWGIRHLLPDRSEQFWIAAGLISSLIGCLGDLTLSVIRRDLGIKHTGVFIIGRGDWLSRVDKLMFVGPLFYYVYLFLQQGL